MRRKTILILCCLNALVAIAVLSIFVPKLLKSSPTQTPARQPSRDAQLSDEELWANALSSSNERELSYLLSKIQDPSFKESALQEQLLKLSEHQEAITLQNLKRYSVFISTHAHLAKTPDNLDLLSSIFHNQALSITLREAALRSCIQACVQFQKATTDQTASDLACDLIDAAYTEKATSLVALALQADSFLIQNEIRTESRLSALQQRLLETLTATRTTEDTLAACLAILKAPIHHNVASNQTLFELYGNQRSETIKAAILTLFTEKADPESEAWLKQQTPSSPKLEQLQLAALEILSAHEAPMTLEGN